MRRPYHVASMTYAVLYRVSDSVHYPYTDDEVQALLSMPEFYDAKGETVSTLMQRLQGREPYLFRVFPDIDRPETLIPITRLLWQQETLELPDELQDLVYGDPEKISQLRAQVFRGALDAESWRYLSFNYRDPPSSAQVDLGGLEPKYTVHFHMGIDLRINGFDADCCNLTHTERRRLHDMIMARQASGQIRSDGREIADLVPTGIFDKYEDIE